MNFRQAKLYILSRLMGWNWIKTSERYHFLKSPNPRTRAKLLYIEDL